MEVWLETVCSNMSYTQLNLIHPNTLTIQALHLKLCISAWIVSILNYEHSKHSQLAVQKTYSHNTNFKQKQSSAYSSTICSSLPHGYIYNEAN